MRDHMMGWTGLIEQQPWTPRRTPARAPTVPRRHLDVPPNVVVVNDVNQGLMLWNDGYRVKHFGAPLAPWLLRLIEARGGKLVFSQEPVTVSIDGGGGDDIYAVAERSIRGRVFVDGEMNLDKPLVDQRPVTIQISKQSWLSRDDVAKFFGLCEPKAQTPAPVTLTDIHRAVCRYHNGAKDSAEAVKRCREILRSFHPSGSVTQLASRHYAQVLQMIETLAPC